MEEVRGETIERTAGGLPGADREGAAPREDDRVGRCLMPDDLGGVADAVREEDRRGEERERILRAAAAPDRSEEPDAPDAPAESVLYRVRFAEPVRFRESRAERMRRRALALIVCAGGLAAGWWTGMRLWQGPLGEMLLPEIGETEATVRRTAAPVVPPGPFEFYGPPLPEVAAGPAETPVVAEAPEADAAPSPSGESAGPVAREAVPPPAGRPAEDAAAGPRAFRGAGRRSAGRMNRSEEPTRNRAVRALARSIERSRRGDGTGAFEDAARAWKTDPTLARAANQLATLSLQAGRWAEAERWSRRAIGADRNHAGARANLGAALLERGRTAAAAAVYAGAIRRNGKDWRAWAGLAAALEEGGRVAEAIGAHDRAVRLAPDRPELRYNRALALAAAGREEEAAGSFLAYLELSGGADPAREGRVRLWLADHGFRKP